MFQFRSRGVDERLKIRNVDSVYVSVSFERSRRAFEDQELALLSGVRQLRQKMAVENRTKKAPPPFETHPY